MTLRDGSLDVTHPDVFTTANRHFVRNGQDRLGGKTVKGIEILAETQMTNSLSPETAHPL